jgi:hypothetical protein
MSLHTTRRAPVPDLAPVLQRHLKPGLYKLTVDADARDFDWESLYINLNQFGNVDQRTGPWDFMLDGTARPLVPAYWVSLNGRKIGLWYFNRPSVQQVLSKRMKREAQFWIEREGDHGIRFEPYRKFTMEWADVRFEASPDDTLLDSVRVSSPHDPSPCPLPQGERKNRKPSPTDNRVTAGVEGTHAATLVVSKPGSALIVVCDYGNGGNLNLKLDPSLNLGGNVSAKDSESNEPVTVGKDGTIQFPLKKHDFKMILVESAR